MNRIFILQKAAIRIIANVEPRRTCRDLFGKLKLLTVYSLYVYQCIVFIKEDSKFALTNSDVHSYSTRQRLDYHRIRHRCNRTENSPFIKGAIFYNKLPNHIKQLDGTKFKTALKNWLVNLCLYDLTYFNDIGSR